MSEKKKKLSPRKARKMLKDKSFKTEKQRKFFGARASGKPIKRTK